MAGVGGPEGLSLAAVAAAAAPAFAIVAAWPGVAVGTTPPVYIASYPSLMALQIPLV
jgi:hypothetical protein